MKNEPTGARRGDRRPLSLRQLAAARYLARGYGSLDIARHLGVNHHTIGRWKRDPRFIAEIDCLRREITAAMISPAAKAPPPPPPMPRLPQPPVRTVVDRDDLNDDDDDDDELEMSDEEAAETAAWVEQIIAAERAGRKMPPPP